MKIQKRISIYNRFIPYTVGNSQFHETFFFAASTQTRVVLKCVRYPFQLLHVPRFHFFHIGFQELLRFNIKRCYHKQS